MSETPYLVNLIVQSLANRNPQHFFLIGKAELASYKTVNLMTKILSCSREDAKQKRKKLCNMLRADITGFWHFKKVMRLAKPGKSDQSTQLHKLS